MGVGRNNPCLEHGLHRQHSGECRVAGVADELQGQRGGRAMGHRIVRTDTLRLDPGWRLDGRLVRSPPYVCERRCRIWDCVGDLRHRLQHSGADSRPGGARCWGGIPGSGKPGADQRIVCRERARPGDRYMVGIDGDHHRDWSGRWVAGSSSTSRGAGPSLSMCRLRPQFWRSRCGIFRKAAASGKDESTGGERSWPQCAWADSSSDSWSLQRLGWRHPLVVGSLAAGVVGLIGFLFIEARDVSPMVPLNLFRRGPFVVPTCSRYSCMRRSASSFFCCRSISFRCRDTRRLPPGLQFCR